MIHLKFKNARLECVEFECNFSEIGSELRSEISLLVEAKIGDIEENEELYDDLFLVEIDSETKHQTYVFSDYELWEYYEVGGLVKLIFVK